MPNPYFSFKQFTVFQGRCAMKVGIDGVLLGAWTSVEGCKNILDVGTGTGLIALMLAQRTEALIIGIDIEKDAVDQAIENVKNSPWKEQINILEQSFQDYANTSNERFDLIISNPPYFVNSLKAPTENRSTARHTDSLSHRELIENAMKILSPIGRISLILPLNEGIECIRIAKSLRLFCSKRVNVYPKRNGEIKRLLLEFKTAQAETEVTPLIIEESRHQYSAEFTEIAKDYYLKL
ncbi:MAG: tRNA1(Val) (adenine(37)-N6)-methyltransferase [Paludibacter sp.]